MLNKNVIYSPAGLSGPKANTSSCAISFKSEIYLAQTTN